MKKSLWWKILLGTALVLVPGSMLLLPLVVAAFHRQRVARAVAVVHQDNLGHDRIAAPLEI